VHNHIPNLAGAHSFSHGLHFHHPSQQATAFSGGGLPIIFNSTSRSSQPQHATGMHVQNNFQSHFPVAFAHAQSCAQSNLAVSHLPQVHHDLHRTCQATTATGQFSFNCPDPIHANEVWRSQLISLPTSAQQHAMFSETHSLEAQSFMSSSSSNGAQGHSTTSTVRTQQKTQRSQRPASVGSCSTRRANGILQLMQQQHKFYRGTSEVPLEWQYAPIFSAAGHALRLLGVHVKDLPEKTPLDLEIL